MFKPLKWSLLVIKKTNKTTTTPPNQNNNNNKKTQDKNKKKPHTSGRKRKNNPWLLSLMKTEPELEEQSAKPVKPWEMRYFPKQGTLSLLVAWRETQERVKSRRDAVL